MNLVVDIGNSLTKIAIFSNSAIQKDYACKKISINEIKDIKSSFPAINNSIVSSVIEINDDLKFFFATNFKFNIILDYNTKLPIKNLYNSKETLGNDRIAAAVGGNFLFPNTNILLIDFGTAITFDLINSNNEYIGGNISPGLLIRFKALNYFTKKLPLLSPKNISKKLGNDTESSIISGVINGILFEIIGYINLLEKKYKGLKIIFTGGDAFFFDRKLKKTIFVDSKITLKGLNRILEYNV